MNPAPPKNSYPVSEASSFAPTRSESSGQADQPQPNPIPPPPPSVVTTNVNPPLSTSPPAPPPIDNPPARNASSIADAGEPPHHKFPFMMITLFLAVVLAGLAGSFLFLSYKGQNSAKTPAQIQITPPVSIAPTETVSNPFATASADLGTNPFASPTAVTNPFGTYQNPFSGATVSATPQAVQNPFEK